MAQVASGQWPVSIIEEGGHGMLRRGTLMTKVDTNILLKTIVASLRVIMCIVS